MRWRVLGALLGVILLAAVVFSLWPSAPAPVTAEIDLRGPVAMPQQPPSPTVVAEARPARVPTPSAAHPATDGIPTEGGELDPEVDPDHLRALGLDEDAIEPLDGGPLQALSREGLKRAVAERLPELRQCYRGWLQPNPALGGKLKARFTIAEIPGMNRAKIMSVDLADAGAGEVAMEECVRNVFKTTRFETPRGGETRVTVPLDFKPGPATR
jgi:hypothetical protein